jgi:hypothetical protein
MVAVLLAGSVFSCNIRNDKNNPGSLAKMGPSFTDTTSVQINDSVYDFGKI